MNKTIFIAIWLILMVGVIYFTMPPWRASYHLVGTVYAEELVYQFPIYPKDYAREHVINRFGEAQWPYFEDLVKRESKWRNEAQNPHSTAYGIGQFLDGTWDDVGCVKTSDPYIQIDCMIDYMEGKYGNPQGAIVYHNKYNSY